jgi:flagellar basal body-associated protein FliL
VDARKTGASPANLDRILLIVIAALGIGIASGTIAGIMSGKRPGDGLARFRRAGEAPVLQGGEAEFDGIGSRRLRVDGGVLVIRPVLRYETEGRGPGEELIAKRAELRDAVMKIVSAKKANELGPAFEGRIKAELLGAFNGILDVARISSVYLVEFELLD